MTEHERLVLSLIAERHRGMPRWNVRPQPAHPDSDLVTAHRRKILERDYTERRTA